MENVLACFFLKFIFALPWIEIRHKIRHCQWENSFTHIYYNHKFIITNYMKNQWNCKEKKVSEAIEENKKKVSIKKLVWYFNLYWKFMRTVTNNDKNKMSWPPPSFYSFLNCWKTAKSTKTKFSDFQFVLKKIKSNCMSGLFCIANLLGVGRQKTFFWFYGF